MIEPFFLSSLTASGCIFGYTLGEQGGITTATPISLALVIGLVAGAAGFGALQYANRRDIRVIKRHVQHLPCLQRRYGKVECGEDIEAIEDLELEPVKKS